MKKRRGGRETLSQAAAGLCKRGKRTGESPFIGIEL